MELNTSKEGVRLAAMEDAIASPSVFGNGVEPGHSAHSERDWLLWQLVDSAFPAGGFAHSAGLEAAAQQGEVCNVEQLCRYIEASLRQFGHSSLLFMTAVYDNPQNLPELDRLCDEFTASHVTNRASRSQGQAFLASAERIFDSPALTTLGSPVGELAICGHFAPIVGAILRALGVDRPTAVRLFAFFHLRGLVSAAVRLGLVGPLQGQALQRRLGAYGEKIVALCQTLSVADIAQTGPLLDLWQANHDRLYSRLFQS